MKFGESVVQCNENYDDHDDDDDDDDNDNVDRLITNRCHTSLQQWPQYIDEDDHEDCVDGDDNEGLKPRTLILKMTCCSVCLLLC